MYKEVSCLIVRRHLLDGARSGSHDCVQLAVNESHCHSKAIELRIEWYMYIVGL